jgi:hypothetical protein
MQTLAVVYALVGSKGEGRGVAYARTGVHRNKRRASYLVGDGASVPE